MKNLMLALLVGGLVFMTANASAADADVGKIKNSELVVGSLTDLDYVACECTVINPASFESHTIETGVNSTANEFGVLPDFYTGEKVRTYHSPLNYWILYKHLLDKPKHDNAITAPRDKLSC